MQNDATTPLQLPEDDPISMANLFYLLHWRNDSIDMSRIDWLQKLIVICDKYQCAENFKDFFLRRTIELNDTDELLVSAAVGDRCGFIDLSESLVRRPILVVQAEMHKELGGLFLSDMLRE